MVALEALKTSITFLNEDVYKLQKFIKNQYLGLKTTAYEVEIHETSVQFEKIIVDIRAIQDYCMYAEHDLFEARNMLVLYCQQFAFAPQMVEQCAALLSCKQRQIPYSYHF